jgi:hypothetical protein
MCWLNSSESIAKLTEILKNTKDHSITDKEFVSPDSLSTKLSLGSIKFQ